MKELFSFTHERIVSLHMKETKIAYVSFTGWNGMNTYMLCAAQLHTMFFKESTPTLGCGLVRTQVSGVGRVHTRKNGMNGNRKTTEEIKLDKIPKILIEGAYLQSRIEWND